MKRNVLMLLITFVASFAGVMLPEAAPYLTYAPTASMIVQVLYCFLSTFDPATPLPGGALKALPRFLLCKMFVVPLLCWAVIHVLFPEYALGALLCAGASIGVMGPFFAYLCGAEPFFVIGGVIASSLILPLSIPLLTAVVLSFDGRSVHGLMEACFGSAVFLACCMSLPFATAKLLWAKKPSASTWLLERRFGITVVCVAAANFTIFSRFSGPLLSNLSAMAEALLAGLVTTGVLLGIGMAAGRNMPIGPALSRIIGISCVNCGLMVIVAAEFFSLPEVLVCTMYTLPLMSMGVPYEFCRRWLVRREARRGTSRQERCSGSV